MLHDPQPSFNKVAARIEKVRGREGSDMNLALEFREKFICAVIIQLLIF